MRAPGAIRSPNDVRNDYAEQNVNYERTGEWAEDVFEIVPLDRIEQRAAWNPRRQKDNYEKIKATGKMPPAILSYDPASKQYKISDGIHRIDACRQLKYDAVPAIVSYLRTARPPVDAGTEAKRSQIYGFELGQIIKRMVSPEPIDWINVEKHEPGHFVLTIERHDDNDYEYAVDVQFQRQTFNATMTGNAQGRASGSMEQVARTLAQLIRRSFVKTAWVKATCKFAQAQVSFNNAPLMALVEKNLGYLQRAIEERQTLTATPFDIASYQKGMETALASVPSPVNGMLRTEFGNIVSMYQAGNIDGARDAIADTIHHIISIDFQKQHNVNWGVMRAAYKVLTNLDEHIDASASTHAPMEQDMAEYRAELMKDYNKAMAQVTDIENRLRTFAQASGRNDVSFRIEPNFSENWETKSQVMYPLNFTVDIAFSAEGRDEFPPNVTLFAEEKDGAVIGYTADDVLSWGDTDFFADASQSKFYFELLDYIKTGKLPTERGTKFIRLYRGMSTNEYVLWERGEIIPAGKFFTKDRTADKAMDISGEFPELYSFSVREDVVVDVGDNNYQTSVPSKMVNKRIVPIQQAQAWVRANCRFAQEQKLYECTIMIGSRIKYQGTTHAVSPQKAEASFWHRVTQGNPLKQQLMKEQGCICKCKEVGLTEPEPIQSPKPRLPEQKTLFQMGPDPFKH